MTDEQRIKRSKYRKKKEVKTKYAKYQKEKFKNIGASFKRTEAEQIAEIFSAHGVKPAEVLRGAAFALDNGEAVPLRAESLPTPDNGTESD